jgi:hypothetical protein
MSKNSMGMVRGVSSVMWIDLTDVSQLNKNRSAHNRIQEIGASDFEKDDEQEQTNGTS